MVWSAQGYTATVHFTIATFCRQIKSFPKTTINTWVNILLNVLSNEPTCIVHQLRLITLYTSVITKWTKTSNFKKRTFGEGSFQPLLSHFLLQGAFTEEHFYWLPIWIKLLNLHDSNLRSILAKLTFSHLQITINDWSFTIFPVSDW